MTVKIAGHWERAWWAPFNEFDLWVHPIHEFGIDEFHMVPVSGIDKARVIEHNDLQEVLDANQDLTHVYFDEAGDVSLSDFVHPENALYILGRTSLSPYKVYAQPGDTVVRIDTIANSGGFWSHQVAAMALYDRFLKSK